MSLSVVVVENNVTLQILVSLNDFKQPTPAICRGRFIAPIADLSAPGVCFDIQVILLHAIINPTVSC
jgi:hypothetical protein